MFKVLASVSGKDITVGKVPLKDEKDWKVSSTGKTMNIGYGRFPISYKGKTGYIQITVALKNDSELVELG